MVWGNKLTYFHDIGNYEIREGNWIAGFVLSCLGYLVFKGAAKWLVLFWPRLRLKRKKESQYDAYVDHMRRRFSFSTTG